MKQKISLFFTVLLVFVIMFQIRASAHKGRTDEYGGHYDRSTGEYHYHHGFEAHQHYDINGDGIPDCPYDYEDRTNHTGGISSGSSRSVSATSETNPPEFFTIVKEVEVPVSRVPDWVYWAFPVFFFIILVMALLIRSKNQEIAGFRNDIKNMKKQHEQELSDLQSTAHAALKQERRKLEQMQTSYEALSIEVGNLKQQISLEKKKQVENYRIILDKEIKDRIINDIGEDYLCALSNAPPGSYVDAFGMPHCIVQGNDIYLFYLSSTGKYHACYCHHAKGCKDINALQIKTRKIKPTPCSVCNPILPDTDWVIRYIQYRELLDSMESEEESMNP